MTTETLTSNRYDLTYATDEYGYRRRRSEQEIEAIVLCEGLKKVLDDSSLSDDDKQRLRGLSADYVVARAPLPAGVGEDTDYDEIRCAMLGYMSSDLPEVTKIESTGLRRMWDDIDGTKVMIDGYPLSTKELEVAYMLIEPSTEVLDRAVETAAYFYAANHTDEQADEAAPNESEPQVPAEYDIDEFEVNEIPSIEDAHTLRDELRHLGGMVISIAVRRSRRAVVDESHQKIAS
jgi:hypothetical protein